MKNIYNFILFSTIFIISCCPEPTEIARYELSENEKKIMPYYYGQKLNFVHNNGYEFNLLVTADSIFWREFHPFCEWICCDREYFSYQCKKTTLAASYPEVKISISIASNIWEEYFPNHIFIHFNHKFFSVFKYDNNANIVCDTINNTIHYDSLQIQDRIYYNVYAQDFKNLFTNSDSTNLQPKKLYMNKENGIIKIEFSNGDSFSYKN